MDDNRRRSEPKLLLDTPKVENPGENYCLQTRLQKREWGKLLTLVGYATTLGSAVPAGYCIGVINSPAAHIKTWLNETLISHYDSHLTSSSIDILWSAIVSIFLIGGTIGSLGGAWAANKFGRKRCYMITSYLFIIGALLFFFCRLANSLEMLIIGRFLVGLASGLTTASLPMYLGEIAPFALRGALSVFCSVGLSGGVVVGQVFSLRHIFGTAANWHIALSFYLVLVVICLIPSYYYPESPKYLYVVRGEREQARRELKRLRGKNEADIVDYEICQMEAELNIRTQKCSFMSVLTNPAYMLPLIIVCAYQGGQQLSGINAIFYYSVSIFEKAGLSTTDAEWANLGAGCLNLFTAFLTPSIMARINRRTVMLLSTAVCTCVLCAIAFILKNIEAAKWLAIACIVCIMVYIFFYQIGLGPVPFIIGTELFEIAPRPVAMSLGSLSNWLCNFLIGMTFPMLQNAIGALVFLPFSLTCALLFILTKFYLPETRGRDPVEIAPLVANGFRSKIK